MKIQITSEDRSYVGGVGDQEEDQEEDDNTKDCCSSFPWRLCGGGQGRARRSV